MTVLVKTKHVAKGEEPYPTLSQEIIDHYQEALKEIQDSTLSLDTKREVIVNTLNEVEEHFILAANKAGWREEEAQALINAILSSAIITSDETITLGNLREELPEIEDQEFETLISTIAACLEGNGKILESCEFHKFGVRCMKLREYLAAQFGAPEGRKNSCGPFALYYLLQLHPDTGFSASKAEQQELFDTIYDYAAPGIFGTHPHSLDDAAEHATLGAASLEMRYFNNPNDALIVVREQLLQGKPVIIKYGSSLSFQHYDTLLSVTSDNVYVTSSGFLIPEKKLKRLMRQQPYANHVWVLKKNELPAIDFEVERRALADR